MNQFLKASVFFFSVFLPAGYLFGQEDLMKTLEEESKKNMPKEFSIATFKSTRLINQQTIETVGRRSLDFRIAHRFGEFNSGGYNFWGLDGGANIKLSLEYSPNGRLMGGFGRSSYQKVYDGFLKYRLLRQTVDGKVPLSITLFSSMYYTAIKDPNKNSSEPLLYGKETDRLSYAHALIIGRKFSDRFSLQFSGIIVHYNMVPSTTDFNDIYALGGAFRFKLTRSFAITGEYAYCLNEYTKQSHYNSAGIGFDLETGGHVFQLHVTNSFGINENQFIPYTTTSWDDGGIRLGFNISRLFAL